MDPEAQSQQPAQGGSGIRGMVKGGLTSVKNLAATTRDWAGDNLDWVVPKGNFASCGLSFATVIAFLFTAIGFALVIYLAVTDQTLLKPFLPNDDGGYNDPKKTFWRLPAFIVPLDYDVAIEPDISSINSNTFTGESTIEFQITQATGQIPLNLARSVDITSAGIIDSNGTFVFASRVRRFYLYDLAVVDFPVRIQPADSLIFKVSFKGQMSTDMRGVYKSNYTDPITNQVRQLVATNLQPTDARMVFPCIDDPARKAPIRMSIILPADQNADVLSNTGLETTATLDGVNGTLPRTKYIFKKSPAMPTYAVAFAVLPRYDYVQATYMSKDGAGSDVVVTIWTRPGQKETARFALNTTLAALGVYEEILGQPFPGGIGKLDILAIPDFAPGATENWGLIIARETAILVDNAIFPSTASKQLVAGTIAHKLAQQWFGNQVTQEWWSHVWLSEGVSTYFEYVVVDRIFPEWRYSRNFVASEQVQAMALDALDTVRPVVYPVNTPSEIADLFYPLTSSKSANLLRMLSLSPKYPMNSKFYAAIRAYLETYKRTPVSTDMFWGKLNQEMDIDNDARTRLVNVTSQWLNGAGFPLVTVTVRGVSLVELRQSRFLLSGTEVPSVYGEAPVSANATPVAPVISQPQQRWWIPIAYRQEGSSVSYTSLSQAEEQPPTIKLTGRFIKVNIDNTGYYRVRYPTEMFRSIAAAMIDDLRSGRPRTERFFSDADRAGFLNDALVLSSANYPTPLLEYKYVLQDALQILAYEDSFTAWTSTIDGLTQLGDLLQDQPCFGNFAYLMTNLIQPSLQRLGWGPVEHQMSADWSVCTANAGMLMSEDADAEQLRGLLLALAVEFDESATTTQNGTVSRLLRLWDCYVSDPNFVLPGSLQPAVFAAKASWGGLRSWNQLLARYRSVQNAQERLRILRALALAKRPDLLNTLLTLTLNPAEVRPQDRAIAIAAVAANPYGGRQIAWDFVRRNWGTLGRASSGVGSIITAATKHFSNEFYLREVDNFFPTSFGYRSTVENAKDQIRRNLAWIGRYSSTVCDLLSNSFPARR